MSGARHDTSGATLVANGSVASGAVHVGQGTEVAMLDVSGEIISADPDLAALLAGPSGDGEVALLVARLAVAFGDASAITIRPLHRGGRVRGVLVETPEPARVEAQLVNRLVGLHGDHSVLLAPSEVRLAEADGATVWLFTERGRLRCPERGLTRLEKRLHDQGFLRVHRHYLVNLRRVREIAPCFGGGNVLVLDGPDRVSVPVSRRRIAQVRACLCQ